MRLWSISPKYLDGIGLVATWREGLLALNVLKGNTKGYKKHPQLDRFKKCNNPVLAVSDYLWGIAEEAKVRNYNFDTSKLLPKNGSIKIPVTVGQLNYEFQLLKIKLIHRNTLYSIFEWSNNFDIKNCHNIFEVILGEIESWEKVKNLLTYSLD